MSEKIFICKCGKTSFIVNIIDNENQLRVTCLTCAMSYDIIYEDDIIMGGKFKIIRKEIKRK